MFGLQQKIPPSVTRPSVKLQFVLLFCSQGPSAPNKNPSNSKFWGIVVSKRKLSKERTVKIYRVVKCKRNDRILCSFLQQKTYLYWSNLSFYFSTTVNKICNEFVHILHMWHHISLSLFRSAVFTKNKYICLCCLAIYSLRPAPGPEKKKKETAHTKILLKQQQEQWRKQGRSKSCSSAAHSNR